MSKKEYLSSLVCIFIIGMCLGMLAIANVGIDTGIIRGASMKNTLTDGDKTLFISEDIKPIKRGDIINLYGYLDEELINVAKRVIGLPGETIFIDGVNVYINDKLLDEPYALYIHEDCIDLNIKVQVKIKENEYFVMGDNRCASDDSRLFGTIPKENILGVMIKSKPSK